MEQDPKQQVGEEDDFYETYKVETLPWDQAKIESFIAYFSNRYLLLEQDENASPAITDDKNDNAETTKLFLEYYLSLVSGIFSMSFGAGGQVQSRKHYWPLLELYVKIIVKAISERTEKSLVFLEMYVRMMSNVQLAFFGPASTEEDKEFENYWRLKFDPNSNDPAKSKYLRLQAEKSALPSPIFLGIPETFVTLRGYEKLIELLNHHSVDLEYMRWIDGPASEPLALTWSLVSEKAESTSLRLNAPRVIVAAFTKIQLSLTREFMEHFSEPFLTGILSFILALPDSEFSSTSLNSDSNTGNLTEILRYIESFSRRHLSKTMVFDRINLFYLQLGNRFLSSSGASLDKKLLSLVCINRALQNIKSAAMIEASLSSMDQSSASILTDSSSRKNFDPNSSSISISSSSFGGRPGAVAANVKLNAQRFSQWLQVSSFFTYMLSADVHSEVLRQASEIFLTLAKWNILGEKHLFQLWDLTLGKHSSFRRIIYDLLLELAPHMNSDLIYNFLNSKLKGVDANDVDNTTLDFLMNVTLLIASNGMSCLKTDNNNNNNSSNNPFKKNFGLYLLWRLSLNKSNVKPEFRIKVYNRLKKLVLSPIFSEMRIPFCRKTIRLIRKNRSVPQSCVLLRDLISSFPRKKFTLIKGSPSMSGVIELLDDEEKIISVLLNNIIAYKDNAHKLARALSESNKAANLNVACLSNDNYDTQSHLYHVEERLNCLEFLLSHSKLTLTVQYAELLWKHLVTENITSEERDLMFGWIMRSNICNALGFKAFNNDVLDYIYKNLVQFEDPSNLTISAYQLFFRLFLCFNEKAGKLKISFVNNSIVSTQNNNNYHEAFNLIFPKYSGKKTAATSEIDAIDIQLTSASKSRVNYEVLDFKRLEGMDYFWKCICSIRDNGVNERNSKLMDLIMFDLSSLAVWTSTRLNAAKRMRAVEHFVSACQNCLEERLRILGREGGVHNQVPILRLLLLHIILIKQLRIRGVAICVGGASESAAAAASLSASNSSLNLKYYENDDNDDQMQGSTSSSMILPIGGGKSRSISSILPSSNPTSSYNTAAAAAIASNSYSATSNASNQSYLNSSSNNNNNGSASNPSSNSKSNSLQGFNISFVLPFLLPNNIDNKDSSVNLVSSSNGRFCTFSLNVPLNAPIENGKIAVCAKITQILKSNSGNSNSSTSNLVPNNTFITPEKVILVSRGSILSDDKRTFAEYGIGPDHVIYVLWRDASSRKLLPTLKSLLLTENSKQRVAYSSRSPSKAINNAISNTASSSTTSSSNGMVFNLKESYFALLINLLSQAKYSVSSAISLAAWNVLLLLPASKTVCGFLTNQVVNYRGGSGGGGLTSHSNSVSNIHSSTSSLAGINSSTSFERPWAKILSQSEIFTFIYNLYSLKAIVLGKTLPALPESTAFSNYNTNTSNSELHNNSAPSSVNSSYSTLPTTTNVNASASVPPNSLNASSSLNNLHHATSINLTPMLVGGGLSSFSRAFIRQGGIYYLINTFGEFCLHGKKFDLEPEVLMQALIMTVETLLELLLVKGTASGSSSGAAGTNINNNKKRAVVDNNGSKSNLMSAGMSSRPMPMLSALLALSLPICLSPLGIPMPKGFSPNFSTSSSQSSLSPSIITDLIGGKFPILIGSNLAKVKRERQVQVSNYQVQIQLLEIQLVPDNLISLLLVSIYNSRNLFIPNVSNNPESNNCANGEDDELLFVKSLHLNCLTLFMAVAVERCECIEVKSPELEAWFSFNLSLAQSSSTINGNNNNFANEFLDRIKELYRQVRVRFLHWDKQETDTFRAFSKNLSVFLLNFITTRLVNQIKQQQAQQLNQNGHNRPLLSSSNSTSVGNQMISFDNDFIYALLETIMEDGLLLDINMENSPSTLQVIAHVLSQLSSPPLQQPAQNTGTSKKRWSFFRASGQSESRIYGLISLTARLISLLSNKGNVLLFQAFNLKGIFFNLLALVNYQHLGENDESVEEENEEKNTNDTLVSSPRIRIAIFSLLRSIAFSDIVCMRIMLECLNISLEAMGNSSYSIWERLFISDDNNNVSVNSNNGNGGVTMVPSNSLNENESEQQVAQNSVLAPSSSSIVPSSSISHNNNNNSLTLKFAGLQNLGCTCYINSLTQQLYHEPRFRDFILRHGKQIIDNFTNLNGNSNNTEQQQPVSVPDENRRFESNNVLVTSAQLYFRALYKLFSDIQKITHINSNNGNNSNNNNINNNAKIKLLTCSIDTVEYCKGIKDFTGRNPVDVYEQMDVQEFLGVILDRIEQVLLLNNSNTVNNSNSTTMLLNKFKASGFGGYLLNEIQPTCNHISQQREPFSSISVEVKHIERLQDGLAQFVRKEELTGDNAFYCERCQSRVAAERHVKLETRPNLLAIHLKRFEFDYTSTTYRKLNDRCEFPLELDISPYCCSSRSRKSDGKEESNATSTGPEGNPPNTNNNGNNDYSVPLVSEDLELDGDGNSKHREGSKEDYIYDLVGIIVHEGNCNSGHYFSIIKDRSTNEWFEFNDRSVTKYDLIKRMENDCFGHGGKASNQKQSSTNNNSVNNNNSTSSSSLGIQMMKSSDHLQMSSSSLQSPSDNSNIVVLSDAVNNSNNNSNGADGTIINNRPSSSTSSTGHNNKRNNQIIPRLRNLFNPNSSSSNGASKRDKEKSSTLNNNNYGNNNFSSTFNPSNNIINTSSSLNLPSSSSASAKKGRNAYMLFYSARKVNTELLLNTSSNGKKMDELLSKTTDINVPSSIAISKKTASAATAAQPPPLLEVFNFYPESLAFLWDLVHVSDVPLYSSFSMGSSPLEYLSSYESLALRFAVFFTRQVLKNHCSSGSSGRENEAFLSIWFAHLKTNFLRKNLEDSKWMLSNLCPMLIQNLVNTNININDNANGDSVNINSSTTSTPTTNAASGIRRLVKDFCLDCITLTNNHLSFLGMKFERTLIFDEFCMGLLGTVLVPACDPMTLLRLEGGPKARIELQVRAMEFFELIREMCENHSINNHINSVNNSNSSNSANSTNNNNNNNSVNNASALNINSVHCLNMQIDALIRNGAISTLLALIPSIGQVFLFNNNNNSSSSNEYSSIDLTVIYHNLQCICESLDILVKSSTLRRWRKPNPWRKFAVVLYGGGGGPSSSDFFEFNNSRMSLANNNSRLVSNTGAGNNSFTMTSNSNSYHSIGKSYHSIGKEIQISDFEVSLFYNGQVLGTVCKDDHSALVFTSSLLFLAWPSPRDFLAKFEPALVAAIDLNEGVEDLTRIINIVVGRLLLAIDKYDSSSSVLSNRKSLGATTTFSSSTTISNKSNSNNSNNVNNNNTMSAISDAPVASKSSPTSSSEKLNNTNNNNNLVGGERLKGSSFVPIDEEFIIQDEDEMMHGVDEGDINGGGGDDDGEINGGDQENEIDKRETSTSRIPLSSSSPPLTSQKRILTSTKPTITNKHQSTTDNHNTNNDKKFWRERWIAQLLTAIFKDRNSLPWTKRRILVHAIEDFWKRERETTTNNNSGSNTGGGSRLPRFGAWMSDPANIKIILGESSNSSNSNEDDNNKIVTNSNK